MVKLNNHETVAYWWVKALKSATLYIGKKLEVEEIESKEQEFYDLFSCFDVQDWRYLYVELAHEVKSYLLENKEIFQCTAAGGHNKMNRLVTNAIFQDVPDVNLQARSSAICVRNGCVVEAYDDDYKILTGDFKENYILTGDEKLLEKSIVTV